VAATVDRRTRRERRVACLRGSPPTGRHLSYDVMGWDSLNLPPIAASRWWQLLELNKDYSPLSTAPAPKSQTNHADIGAGAQTKVCL
jgi:hypothetical protein